MLLVLFVARWFVSFVRSFVCLFDCLLLPVRFLIGFLAFVGPEAGGVLVGVGFLFSGHDLGVIVQAPGGRWCRQAAPGTSVGTSVVLSLGFCFPLLLVPLPT